ncbi:MAG: hypothetical protein N2690_06380, partial [Rhodocyclaceae bacterium]|nr:hypothetical protein [Rhodocyclaceae bacterium]
PSTSLRASSATIAPRWPSATRRARLARAHEDEREIAAKIARYQEILARGRTQPERRLEWVEILDGIKKTRRLLDLNYEIAPQRLLDPKQPAAGGYEFHTSPMKLELPLLHEEDLLGLLADLSRQSEALVSVRSCRIERQPVEAAHGGAPLKAACELDWITLREKS